MDSYHRALETRPDGIWVMFAFCQKSLFMKVAEKWSLFCRGKCAVNSSGILPQHFILPFKEIIIISFFLSFHVAKKTEIAKQSVFVTLSLNEE